MSVNWAYIGMHITTRRPVPRVSFVVMIWYCMIIIPDVNKHIFGLCFYRFSLSLVLFTFFQGKLFLAFTFTICISEI